MLPAIAERCFFWLDAHFPAFYEPSFAENQAVRFPASYELMKIHGLRGGAPSDVIAVDDLRVLRSADNPRYREGEVGDYFAAEGWSVRDLTERFEGTHSAAVLCDQEGVLVLEPLAEPGN